MKYRTIGWLLLAGGLIVFLIKLQSDQPLSDIANLIDVSTGLVIAIAGLVFVLKYKNQNN